MKKEEFEEKPKSNKAGLGKAQASYTINQNEIFITINKGDDLDALNIPDRFIQTLKTEGVLDAK